MVMVAKIFLTTRSDVQTPRQFIAEENEHTYFGCMSLLIEFNMTQEILIGEKLLDFINCVFEGGHKTCCSRN